MRFNFLILLGLLCVALTACPATEEETDDTGAENLEGRKPDFSQSESDNPCGEANPCGEENPCGEDDTVDDHADGDEDEGHDDDGDEGDAEEGENPCGGDGHEDHDDG